MAAALAAVCGTVAANWALPHQTIPPLQPLGGYTNFPPPVIPGTGVSGVTNNAQRATRSALPRWQFGLEAAPVAGVPTLLERGTATLQTFLTSEIVRQGPAAVNFIHAGATAKLATE